MATQTESVTEIKFYDINDVMRITKYKRSKAYEIIKAMNKKLEAQGKFTIDGKIAAFRFHSMF